MVDAEAITRDALRTDGAVAAMSARAVFRIVASAPNILAFIASSFRDYIAGGAGREALAGIGLTKGERVAIMVACGVDDLRLASQSLGAIVFGIYQTASAAEVEYQLRDGGAVFFIAADQAYVDKILPIIDRSPDRGLVIVIDDSAMFAYDHAKLMSYEKLVGPEESDLDWLEAQVSRVSARDPAIIVYTSGTTGHPKGALIAHGKHLAAAVNLVDHYPTLAEKQHRTVAYLPLCHILGRDIAVTLPLISRLVPHFGEDPEDLATTMFEVAPTVLFTVPRYLQKFAAQIVVGISNSSTLKRMSYEFAMRLARRHIRRLWDGIATGADQAAYRACHAAVFRPILNKLGFDGLSSLSRRRPLPPETMALWQMYGVNVLEVYGQTEEAGGIIAGQRGQFPRPGNVGTAPDGWDVRLADDGEVLVRSPDLFDSYWRNEDATRAVKQADGWLRTGDIGEWTDGALRLVDRARDFIVTSGGKTISPSFIENGLRASPYISEAVVFGHSRKYLTALVEIDFDMVSDWARRNDVAYTGFTNLVEKPPVVRLIKAEIDKINVDLARVEQIKTFRILPKALDPEDEGEPVTPTRKIKRTQMYERFKPLVEAKTIVRGIYWRRSGGCLRA